MTWVRLWGLLLFFTVLLPLIRSFAFAQPRAAWEYTLCLTNKCVKETLDALPPDRAAEAKLTTDRTFTYVWYRK